MSALPPQQIAAMTRLIESTPAMAAAFARLAAKMVEVGQRFAGFFEAHPPRRTGPPPMPPGAITWNARRRRKRRPR